ncbi:MAG: MgtC/SapB family protein, partial [Pseudorhodoplanes sp.]
MPAMTLEELLSRLAVALGIGLLIGLERHWKTRDDQAGSRAAGLRTFSITGLLGGIAAALAAALGGATSAGGGLFLGLCLVALAGIMTVFARDENLAEKSFSATTAVAAVVTFALGAFAVLGDMRAAAAGAVATAGLLALRQPLHGWVQDITWPELRSVLILLAMTFIVLPVLPNDPVGPYGGVN